MSTIKTQLGRKGEEAASSFLLGHGYRIIERNFRNRIGEIDIIAYDRDILVFIEVKTRRSEEYILALESVTQAKQAKIIQVASSYVKYKRLTDVQIRFDVMAVIGHMNGIERIDLFKHAFEAY